MSFHRGSGFHENHCLLDNLLCRLTFHEIHEISGIPTTPGGTLRVLPPRLRVLEISAKFHPISRIPWKWTPRHPVGCRGVHDPGHGHLDTQQGVEVSISRESLKSGEILQKSQEPSGEGGEP